jgi:hypothetical protein
MNGGTGIKAFSRGMIPTPITVDARYKVRSALGHQQSEIANCDVSRHN